MKKLVLQRKYLSKDMPEKYREWHDHPEPEKIAWGKGRFETIEENMRDACYIYHLMSNKVEFRMVERTDKTIWSYPSKYETQET